VAGSVKEVNFPIDHFEEVEDLILAKYKKYFEYYEFLDKNIK
jgi:hypothetical protein